MLRSEHLFALGVLLVGIALLPTGQYPALGLLALPVAVILAARRLTLGQLLRRTWPALPLAVALSPLLLTVPGPRLAVGPLTISQAGWERALWILSRALVSLWLTVALLARREHSQLVGALAGLGLPGPVVTALALMLRYLELLAQEAGRLRRARLARQVGRSPGLLHEAQVAGMMVGNLFVRSLERSERVYQAMLARGYDGSRPPLQETRGRTQWAPVVGALALVGLALWYG